MQTVRMVEKTRNNATLLKGAEL